LDSPIEKVIRAFIADENAVKLLLDIWIVIQAWDDAYDGDENDHVEGYKKAMVDLPNNPLYVPAAIAYQIKSIYIDWMAANKFEKRKEHLNKAYMLRASYYRIIIHIVDFLYGVDSAVDVADKIWSCYGEEFKDFEGEILNA